MRKTFAMMVVAILAGLGPAIPGIDLCMQPACCAEMVTLPASFDAPDCCTTIRCDDAAPDGVAAKAEAKVCAAPPSAVASAVSVTPRVSTPRAATHDTSPPPTMSERLSSLSLFLI